MLTKGLVDGLSLLFIACGRGEKQEAFSIAARCLRELCLEIVGAESHHVIDLYGIGKQHDQAVEAQGDAG